MRTTDERIAAMHRRAAELQKEKRKKQTRLAGALSIAACFALAIVLAILIPGASENAGAAPAPSGMTASVFSQTGSLGYIVVAIIAFLLGISATVFCFRLKKWRDSQDDEDNV